MPSDGEERDPQYTIMIVEDELLLRLDLANQLHSAGFEVIRAQCADEALQVPTLWEASGCVIPLAIAPLNLIGSELPRGYSTSTEGPRGGDDQQLLRHVSMCR